MEDAPDHRSKLPTDLVTWTTLLGHWTDLVKAGEGLRRAANSNPDAARWRDSIPEVIRLQAITFALGDLDRLHASDRGLARDRAGIGIEAATNVLDSVWAGLPIPEALTEIAQDASQSLQAAVYAGLRWTRWVGPDRLEMPQVDLDAAGIRGTLACAQPGTTIQPGSPVAWWTEREPPTELGRPGFEVVPGPPVQVYRHLEHEGRRIRDFVASIFDRPEGLPLLVPICLAGDPIGRFTVDAAVWRERNRSDFESAVEDAILEFAGGAAASVPN
ncbi:MAG: hypothetical protein OSA40_01030 [Phycisphaerales bacterium]|nr:hypothetical protein [Phycisphaerales bacterium]